MADDRAKLAHYTSDNKVHGTDYFEPTIQDIASANAYNKSTAFTVEERKALKLRGLLPAVVETLDLQLQRALLQLRSFEKDFDKYVYLQSLAARNLTLFYKVSKAYLSILWVD